MEAILPFVFLAVMVGVLFVALGLARRRRGRFASAAEALGTKPVKQRLFSGARYEGMENGAAYHLRYREASKYTPAALTVGVSSEHPVAYRLAKQDKSFALFARFVGSGLATGDPAFDGAYYLQRGEASRVAPLFRSVEVRDAVRRVFAAGATYVEASGGELRAIWQPFAIKEGIALDFVRKDAVPALLDLGRASVRAVPLGLARAGEPRAGKLAGGWLRGGPVVAGVGVGLALASSSDWPTLDTESLFFFTLRYSAPLALVALFVGLKAAARVSRAPRDLVGAALAIPAVLVAGGFIAGEIANRALDQGAVTTHDAVVAATSRERDRGGRRIWVVSWRAQEAFEEIPVSYRVHREIVPERSIVRVSTRPGALGFEWVDDVAVTGEKAAPVDTE